MRNKGLTLIEIMVSLAIVGLIVSAAVGGLRTAFNVNMKKAAGSLAATLRFLSNKAVTDHLYLRVVYDFEANAYRIEESQDPIVISVEDEESKPGGKKDAKEDEGEESPSPFVVSDSKLLKPVKFPSGVFFKDVAVSYLKDKKTEGEAATYFFPDGYATPTVINLRNKDDDDHFSIEVMALSGRVKVANAYKESLSEEPKP